MRRPTTKGKCALCGAVYSKGGMTKHLAKCAPQRLASSAAGGARTAESSSPCR